MYDYDRRASSFDFTLHFGAAINRVGGPELLQSLSKVFVDGRQLGLLSSIHVSTTASNPLPSVQIGVLEGLSREDFERSSEHLQKSAREVVSDLRRFPSIEVVCPGYL